MLKLKKDQGIINEFFLVKRCNLFSLWVMHPLEKAKHAPFVYGLIGSILLLRITITQRKQTVITLMRGILLLSHIVSWDCIWYLKTYSPITCLYPLRDPTQIQGEYEDDRMPPGLGSVERRHRLHNFVSEYQLKYLCLKSKPASAKDETHQARDCTQDQM